ncbi:serine/threonine protein kinase [Nocardiopsis sp. NPDC050513]|uniref:serine/threonine protein kinase n=1 Tax=Nocardiopsis sp. NPDC050513 TaxID=3364338 RepID=UPI00378839D4
MSGSEHAAWAPGYEPSTVLRQGRRARIVRATRSTSGADVVLKVLPAAPGRAELDRLRDLSGVPGVVPLLDAGTTAEGELFVVLPFYADGSFADMLARRGPAPIQEAAAVARSAAAALGAMHGRGLVHNDVSPGNVLRAGRTPVLTGFGAVHPIGAAVPPPPPGSESFLHASPEALRGEPRTPASDVYQLASTIWTMLVGRTPFASEEGFDAQAYARRVLTEDAQPVGRQDISRKLRGVLTRALAKSPDERHESAAEFAAAFEQARTSRPATTVSGASGAQTPLTGAPSGPYAAPSGPQPPQTAVMPVADPPTIPHTAPSGAQAPYAPREHLPAPPYAAPPHPDTGPHGAPAAPPAPPNAPLWPRPQPDGPAQPSAARLEGAQRLRGEPRPDPGDDQHGSRLPATDAGGTAEIMMAKLRGEEISPLLAWSRVEGWSGTAESGRLPDDGPAPQRDDAPAWADPGPDPAQVRWRKNLHLAATVCGILLLTSVSGAFASVGPRNTVLSAAGPEEPAAEPSAGADAQASGGDDAGETVEPTVPEAIGAPANVLLEDSLDAVRLSWTDNSGGTAPFFVVGGRQNHEPATLARTGAGVTSAQITTADTYGEYCFTVVAVDGSASAAEEVCTRRSAARAEAAAAEEEAAEEEREQDAEPSEEPSPDPAEE